MSATYVTVNNKKYQLGKWYSFKLQPRTLLNMKNSIEMIIGNEFPMEYFYKDFVVTNGPNPEYVFHLRNNINRLFETAKYRMQRTAINYATYDNYNGNNPVKEVDIIIRKHFSWPQGYFGDRTSCWHTFNSGAPLLLEKNGCVWICGYTKKDANGKRKPLFRAGLFPDGTACKNSIIHSSAGEIYNKEITQMFAGDTAMHPINFSNKKSRKNVLYFSADMISTHNYKDKIDGTMKVTADTYGLLSIKADIDDYEWKPVGCACGMYKFNNQAILKHVCGSTLKVNTKLYPK